MLSNRKSNYFIVYRDNKRTLYEWQEEELDDYVVQLKFQNKDDGSRFKLIQEWKIYGLEFENASFPIFKILADIYFQNLQTLNLNKNNIEGIQSVSHMFLPSLQTFIINQNHLTNIKSFRKIYWEKLTRLQICNNRVNDGQPFTQTHFPSSLDLIIELNWNEFVQFYDLRFLAKLSAKKIYQIKTDYSLRIQEGLVQQVISRKYEDMNVNGH